LITRYEIDKAYADYVSAKLRPNPIFTFNAIGLDYYSGYPKRDDTTQVSTRIDQLIELGGKRKLRTESALAGHEVATLAYRDVIRNLLIGFYTVYYNLNLDLLNIEFAKEELRRFDRILDIAERRFNAGFLSQLDYSKIKLAKIDLENNLTNFEAQLKKDLENFNFLIGGDKQFEPSRLVIRDVFPAFSEENLIDAGLKNRYDLLAVQKQSEVARHNMALAKALRIPDLSVGVEYDSFGADGASRVGGGVSIGIPVFNRAQGTILKSNAEYKQVEGQIKKVTRLVISDVRQSLTTYQSSVKVFEAYRTRKAEMEDLLSKSEAAFSLGGITVLDLLDTRRTYRDFITKYNQTLTQTLLNQELIKVYTGEVR
jgi:cobalt-zinc-cadmium efflux system outer membrane protein